MKFQRPDTQRVDFELKIISEIPWRWQEKNAHPKWQPCSRPLTNELPVTWTRNEQGKTIRSNNKSISQLTNKLINFDLNNTFTFIRRKEARSFDLENSPKIRTTFRSIHKFHVGGNLFGGIFRRLVHQLNFAAFSILRIFEASWLFGGISAV